MEPDHWKREKINFWLLFLKYGASTFSLLYILTNAKIKVKISRKWKRIFCSPGCVENAEKELSFSILCLMLWSQPRVTRKEIRKGWVGGVSWVWQLPSQSDSDYIRKYLLCMNGQNVGEVSLAVVFYRAVVFAEILALEILKIPFQR